MPKMSKAQLGAMGKKIMTEAKRIQHSSGMTKVSSIKYKKPWTQCVKEASKKLKK